MSGVREATEADLGALLRLYLYLHENGVPEDSPRLRESWAAILADRNHHILVYEADGAIVSSCVCVVIPNLTRGVRPYALIENVVTRSDCRNRGYAGACMDAARRVAREAGCYKLMLLTGSKRPEVLRFYENRGYNSADKTAFVQWLQADDD